MNTLLKIAFLLILNLTGVLTSGRAQCFEDCFDRMNNSDSPFAQLDVLKELIGCEAPEFSVKTIDGEKISLASLKGRVVVINYWFVGCKPCIAEMPRLNEIVDVFEERDVVFLSFALDSEEDIKSKFLPKRTFRYKIIAGEQNTNKKYCVSVYPTHFVIGRNGNVVLASFASVDRPENADELTAAIERAVDTR